ncbi:MAG TPA: thioredoxin-disulfide reductase [Dehalococcoidia bacterium]|nr:thioredoxin-disulfide reductase [Dehalococcoidia bacterium]
MTVNDYDIVIVGGGPAGLSAGLYAARARRKTLLIERGVIGGQISLTSAVENYPGFMSINGFDLAQEMRRQAEANGLRIVDGSVTSVDLDGAYRVVKGPEAEYRAKAVILAGGADHNRLGVPGEERLTGRGVSYCATCDAAFFKDMEVAVVGGGDSALDEGLFVARYASKVTIIHRRDQLRASRVLQERAFAEPKITFRWNTVVTEIEGESAVEAARLRDVVTGEESRLAVAGVFVFIGTTPNTAYLKGLVDLDAGGHVVTDLWMRTSVPGIFAAGDIRTESARQVVSSAGDGATAAIAADHYISDAFPG